MDTKLSARCRHVTNIVFAWIAHRDRQPYPPQKKGGIYPYLSRSVQHCKSSKYCKSTRGRFRWQTQRVAFVTPADRWKQAQRPHWLDWRDSENDASSRLHLPPEFCCNSSHLKQKPTWTVHRSELLVLWKLYQHSSAFITSAAMLQTSYSPSHPTARTQGLLITNNCIAETANHERVVFSALHASYAETFLWWVQHVSLLLHPTAVNNVAKFTHQEYGRG